MHIHNPLKNFDVMTYRIVKEMTRNFSDEKETG